MLSARHLVKKKYKERKMCVFSVELVRLTLVTTELIISLNLTYDLYDENKGMTTYYQNKKELCVFETYCLLSMDMKQNIQSIS